MLNVRLKCLILFVGACQAFPRRRIPLNRDMVNDNKVSVDTTIDKNAFGTCMCDLTYNACDAYCCCDLDCGSAILDVWKSNYA